MEPVFIKLKKLILSSSLDEDDDEEVFVRMSAELTAEEGLRP